MNAFYEAMEEYKKQLEKGVIQVAYKGLMEYFMTLRYHFSKKYPDYNTSSGIYYGYMDMTYFSCSPKSIKQRDLKVAIVFLHEKFQFEVWLAGVNKQIQGKYWNLIHESGWDAYRLTPSIKGYESIVEHTLVEKPDFRDLDALTGQLENGVMKFIRNVEDFLAKH
jgi:hypothetical protein